MTECDPHEPNGPGVAPDEAMTALPSSRLPIITTALLLLGLAIAFGSPQAGSKPFENPVARESLRAAEGTIKANRNGR